MPAPSGIQMFFADDGLGERSKMMKTIKTVTREYPLRVRLWGKCRRDSAKPAILFFSGWNPSPIGITGADLLAPFIARKLDCICITATLRGMGSKGDIESLTRSDFLQDALAIYDFISIQPTIDKDHISVVGESFGGYLACLLSSKRKVENLILRVPTDFPNEGFLDKPQLQIAGNRSREWKLQKHTPDDSFALQALKNYKGSICLVASEHDEMVPCQTTQNYIDAVTNPDTLDFHLMKDCGHALISPIKMKEYFNIVCRFVLNRHSMVK
jgi:uncharacterized protein